MTTSLDSYLHGAYKEDGAFLRRLTNTIREVLPVFYEQVVKLRVKGIRGPKETTWPYAISDPKSHKLPEQTSFSSSTHCMILFALDSFDPRAKDKYSILLGKGFRPHGLLGKPLDEKRLQAIVVDAKKALVRVVRKTSIPPLVKSGTYGEDDPFTLTWLTEIAFRWTKQPGVKAADLKAFKKQILAGVKTVLARANNILDSAESTLFSEVHNSFLEVRRLHLALSAKRLAGRKSFASNWLELNTPELWKNFDDTIHRQLSYSSMGDTRFDPAELALAFEGALLLHPGWVGRSTVDEVFEALKLSQNPHPYWRPITPFLANDKGHVLFMISIEVANSILRSCEILDEVDPHLSRFSQIEPQLRTYAMWLSGEKEEIADKNQKPNFVGWRTEYEDKRNTIQLWHTSHVLVFLAHYASLLKRKIAADGIDAAGLQVRMTKEIKGYWSDEPLPDLADKVRRYAVHRTIKSKYIDGRKNARDASNAPHSILLYGPPGTGKTTVAEQMAFSLQRPLITITVSDFLAAGAAEIENRAKGVFEVLRAQDEIVVLFDEIDQFLLDRNSKLYKDQDDIFKFMTPGMLTKLQDLREAEGCIFIIATNYYERIDSAIKRRGRIDQHLLLCVPDQTQRQKLVDRFLLDRLKNKKAFKSVNFKKAAINHKVHEKTALFGYGDLKNLVELKIELKPGMDVNSLAKALAKKADPGDSAVTLSAYKGRFNETDMSPFEEFFLLLYLVLESGRKLTKPDLQTIHQVLDQVEGFDRKNFKALKEYIQENVVYKKLYEEREKILEGWENRKPREAPKTSDGK